MEECHGTLGKRKQNKHASVVAIHFPSYLYNVYGYIVLSSFSAKDQRITLETKWNSDFPLCPEEIETQGTIGIEVQ